MFSASLRPLIPPALQAPVPALPCSAVKSGWHHMAFQAAFWGLAWRKEDTCSRTQISLWWRPLLLLTASPPLVKSLHWVLQSVMPTHLSGAETHSSPQGLPRCGLGWVHQSLPGNTTHPPTPPSSISAAVQNVLLLNARQNSSHFRILAKHLKLFWSCPEVLTASHNP